MLKLDMKIRKFLIFLCLSVFLAFGKTTINIYHINDFHDNLVSPVGAPKIADFLKKHRDGNSLFLVAGDFISGTAFGRATSGESSFKAFSFYLKPDAVAVGNHEFDYGWKRLVELYRKYPLSLISANIFYQGKRLFPDSTQFIVAGKKVTVAGLTTVETSISTFKKFIKGLEFKDEVSIAKELVRKYRASSDLLVLLSHCGIEKDREIAEKVDGFDIIVGGHDHIKANEKIKSTTIVQAGSYGRYIGEIKIEFKGEKKNIHSRLISMKDYPGVEKETSSYVKRLSERLSTYLNRFCCISRTRYLYNENRIRSKSDPLATLLGETLKNSLSADAVLINAGAIRGGIPKGKVFYKHWLKVYPFQGQIMVLGIRGKYLKQVIEKHLSTRKPSTAYLQMTGIKIEKGKIFVGAYPIQDKKVYRVVIPEFLYMGGDGYTMFKNADSFHYVNMTFPEFFFSFFKRKGVIE